MYKIGQSTDIHPFKENRKLILGGVEIPYHKGLDGHSDADALLHAIAEAILGALGMKDLGHLFDDSDEKTTNISSLIILKEVYKIMVEKGYEINNVDSLIIIEEPKMKNYLDKMVHNIAFTLNCEESCINVKATCEEKLGFIGEKKGVAAQAVVLLKKVKNNESN